MLNPEYFLTDWDKVIFIFIIIFSLKFVLFSNIFYIFYIFYYKNSKERINFSKRSYIKENELENRDICYTISHGREFGNVGKEKLGKLGKDIIEKFIIDNKKREKLLFEKEKN